MPSHYRRGHYRRGKNGTLHWVSGHSVRTSGTAFYDATASSRGRPILRARSNYVNARPLLSPNAKCPVCGAAVFFYSNSYGSRVYFDDVGPPWPKHPCTDQGYAPRSIRAIAERVRAGFRPKLRRYESAWWVLEATPYRDGMVLGLTQSPGSVASLWVLTKPAVSIDPGSLVYLNWASVEYLDLGQMAPLRAELQLWCLPGGSWQAAPLPSRFWRYMWIDGLTQ